MPSTDSSLHATSPSARSHAAAWLRGFLPGRMSVNWRVVAGAMLGLALTAGLCRSFGNETTVVYWIVAPVGASAVLLFGLPASPLAQPWAAIGGNTVSALVGIACVQAFGVAPWVAGLAVALAIAAMFALRCLHPPGGSSALMVVMAGVHDFHFAFSPIFLNTLLLVAAAIAYNNLTGRRYPHSQRAPAPTGPAARAFSEADLDAVLARYNQVLDVSRDDLQSLLADAEVLAYQRKLGATLCSDIMSRDLATAEYGTPLQDAWSLLRQRQIKALPVIDRASRIIGIVTLADFMRGADIDLHDGWAERLSKFIRPTPGTHSDKAEVVGQIMSRKVRVASAGRTISELVPLFAATDHHHIPIIDSEQRLVGIITQSDIVAALSHLG